MKIFKQKTVKNNISFKGVGLHSGKEVNVKVCPSKPNTGIVFKRTDMEEGKNIVHPEVSNVSSAILCTTISNEFGCKVSTIEHLMGALFGLGIDNALIEIDNEEVPIDGKKNISIEPSKINLEIDFEIKYDNTLIGTQKNKIKVYEDDLNAIYDSRTFCLFDDIDRLRANGLALGGSLDNAIVVKGNEILNKEKMRNSLEFVNHKILDCMGDLYLSGYKIIGKLSCSQGGHKLTNDLLRKVFADKSNFSLVEIDEKTLSPTLINKQNLELIA